MIIIGPRLNVERNHASLLDCALGLAAAVVRIALGTSVPFRVDDSRVQSSHADCAEIDWMLSSFGCQLD